MNYIPTKKIYQRPVIEKIELDNEIALTMESSNPQGEPDNWGVSENTLSQNPYNNNMA